LVFVGGQISADQHGRTIGVGDIETQTRNVFENSCAVVHECGATMQDSGKFNTFYVYDGPPDTITDYWEKMTRVRMEFFEDPAACGTGVRVTGLAYPDLLIGVEAIAVIPPERMAAAAGSSASSTSSAGLAGSSAVAGPSAGAASSPGGGARGGY